MPMIKRARVILVVVALGGLYSLSVAAADKTAFLNAEAIIAGWRAHYGAIDRMHFRLSEEVIDRDESKKSPLNLVKFQIADMTADKNTKRFHLQYAQKEGGLDDPLRVHEAAFDGKATKDYWGNGPQKRGRIAPGVRGTTPYNLVKTFERYLLLFEVGPEQDGKVKWVPLMDYLSDLAKNDSARVVVKDNLETVANEECHAIEVRYRERPTMRLWFAQDKGMLPMKYQLVSEDGEVIQEMAVLDTAKSETDTGVMWYPSKAHLRQRAGGYDASGKEVVEPVTYELKVSAFTPNVAVEESTFQFAFPAGTLVRDEVAGGLEYTVGPPKPGSPDRLDDREASDTRSAIKGERSDQTRRASQGEIVSDGDSNSVEMTSIHNVLGKDSQAGTSRTIDVRTILCCSVLACLMLATVILRKWKRAKEHDKTQNAS